MLQHYPLRLKLGAISALLLFVGALLVVGLVVWRQDSQLWRVGEDMTWHAYKLDRDVVQLRNFLLSDRPGAESLEGVRLRFELLYSRLNLLESGDIAELLDSVPPAASLAQDIQAHIRTIDDILGQADVMNDTVRDRMERELAAMSEPTERLVVSINSHLAESTTQERERLKWLYGLLLVLILAMSVAAMMVVAFLFRESRDNARARRTLEELSDELEITAHQAQSASQAKSEFLATVSHEIRTPLNGVIGMSELLTEHDLPSDARHYADTIHDSAQRLLELINDILDFSKIEAGRLDLEARSLPLDELLSGATSLFAPHAEARGIQLTTWIDPELPSHVVSDPGRLRQILLNLLSNAIKFTDQGEVRVSAFVAEGDELAIEVVDSGCGIEPERQAQLFEPFHQGDPSTARRFGGTGLGLAICKRLVEALGGRIGMHSQEGLGSRCWVRLPLVAGVEEVEDAALGTADDDNSALQGTRLLVVEDNPVNRQVAMAMLERLGCRVSLVSSGAEALERIKTQVFDLVFMDVQMPDMDGLEVTRRLRASNGWAAEVPIVAMTAGGYGGDQARCLAAGMNGYLVKPMFQDDLQAVLRRHLLHAQGEIRAREVTVGPEQLLDEAVIEALEQSLGRGELQELLAHYRHQAGLQLTALREAMAGGDDSDAIHQAHQLKGESASLGAVKVAGAAMRLELAGKEQRLDAQQHELQHLESLLESSIQALEARWG
ncbi:ATP-binding protein [Halomonas sabkhae]|uniref:ATP-binding protein n=1 Tax=Halomonas sabkhae TaxID=626223 RepID=UPI0025B56556|nr:ATP-binding protein [Halomonas sabkhae]MDN3524059.1 ATP-binding protein [Halomonas sabkhae]